MNTSNEHDDIRNALATGESLSMLPHEREASKALLAQYVRANPAMAPWYVRIQDSFVGGLSGLDMSHAQPAFAAVLMVIFVGAGTSYAAENAVPGDILYPVKKVVNEGVRSAIAVTPAAQVEWQTERVNRRLAEVSKLAEHDALTPSITRTIERDVSDAADEIELHGAAAVAASDTIAAPRMAKAESELHVSIQEHARQLSASVGNDRSTSTREEVASIVAHVRGRFHTEDDSMATAIAAVSDSDDTSDSRRSRRTGSSGKRQGAPTLMSAQARGDDGASDARGISATAAFMPATTSTSTPTLIPSVSRSGHGEDEDEREYEDD